MAQISEGLGGSEQSNIKKSQHDHPFEVGACGPPLWFPSAAQLPGLVQTQVRELLDQGKRGVKSLVHGDT